MPSAFPAAFRTVALLLVAGVLIAGLTAIAARSRVPGADGPVTGPIDFLAFYCAGKTAGSGADPYRAEPLRTCERAALAESKLHMVPHLVVPAPLPPYALAPLSLLGLLPFRWASPLWFALLVVAGAATIVLMRRLTQLPLLALTAAFALSDVGASIVIGQLVPFVILALCACALALREGKPQLAALCAAATLVEPHAGVPLCLALSLWEPRTRRTLGWCVLALGALSLAAGGIRGNLEYLTQVLPAQARVEGLAFGGQYSLSAFLARTGVAPVLALAAGSFSYLVMLALGVACARALARTFDDRAFLALTPPAFVLLGGAYVHIQNMAAALPLALALAARKTRLRALCIACAIVLAIPYQSLVELPGVGSRLFPFPPNAPHVDVRSALAAVDDGSLLAEEAWGVWVRLPSRESRTFEEQMLTKLPTWLALAALLACALALARRDVARERLAFHRT